MPLLQTIAQKAAQGLEELYGFTADAHPELQPTRKEFEGDVTLVVFPYLRASRKKPEATAEEMGHYLQKAVPEIADFNVVKGFLNLAIADGYWIEQIETIRDLDNYGRAQRQEETILVEYSSPNTNKPLHLGHIRNILLGFSVAQILEAAGKTVKKVQIVNDRGIHICKSMLAWQKFGAGETPESSGLKGDHLVGKYYVEFDRQNNIQAARHLLKLAEAKERDEKLSFSELSYEKQLAFLASLKLEIERTVYNAKDVENNLPLKEYQKIDIQQLISGEITPIDFFKFCEQHGQKMSTDQFLSAHKEAGEIKEGSPLEENNKWIEYSINQVEAKRVLTQKVRELEDVNFRFLKAYYNEQTELLNEARTMLKKWEADDPETVALWKKMNGWVYAGFEKTYQKLGVGFDQNYYESETYLLGKKVVEEGLDKGVFFTKEDGSVWCDLEDEKLGEKLLLRKDGTSVYMTQDIGTAIQRYEDFGMAGMVYTVGNEQDHHFKVLFAILKKLGYAWAERLYHLSYGMVDLPSGKMKSREGTVVDADDLVQEMESTAQKISEELGKTEGMSEDEKQRLYHQVGLGALKYYILRVDPRKRMLFNPEESVDFQGDTGPFIQYTYARIKSLLRKSQEFSFEGTPQSLHPQERELCKQLLQYPQKVSEAAEQYSPATIASYVYDLVKVYNALYQQVPILTDEDPAVVAFRVKLSERVAAVIKSGMALLGIEVPERM